MVFYPEPESDRLEFKKEIPKNDQIVKTLIGFCNRFGGKLVIGVEDNGRVVGLPESQVQSTMEYLEKSVYEASAPPIIPQVSIRSFEDKLTLVIQVSSGMNKPYYRISEGLDRGTYIRLGRSTVRATADMIEELRWASRGRFFDAFPVYHASIKDLDEVALDTFARKKKSGASQSLSLDTLASYRVVVEEHGKTYPTVNGILCFGKKPQEFFSESMIICSRFKGVEGRDALASIDCVGTLTMQWEQALYFIFKHLEHSFQVKGVVRDQELEIPEVAIREVLINMIIHRNYHHPAPSKIAIYDDRIEFFSPGSFPGPLDSQKLTEGISYLRNPNICKIFRELGLIEKLGSGFIALFRSYEKKQLVPPYVIEGSDYVKCVLPRKLSSPVVDKKSIGDSIVLYMKQRGKVSIKEIMSHLSITRSTAQRKVKKLLDDKVIERGGSGPSTHYQMYTE